MKKIIIPFLTLWAAASYADSGLFIGGGIGYGMQTNNFLNNSNTVGSPALRFQLGYQLADWLGAEVAWNYITQGSNWNNLGQPSSTIYDLAFTPGFTIPATPITTFVRLGISSVSTNFNNSWYNQVVSNSAADFEYGAGVKVSIPGTSTFVRAEYINYGNSQNNNNSSVTTSPAAVLIDAGYVF
jgi:hypothetical protein